MGYTRNLRGRATRLWEEEPHGPATLARPTTWCGPAGQAGVWTGMLEGGAPGYLMTVGPLTRLQGQGQAAGH